MKRSRIGEGGTRGERIEVRATLGEQNVACGAPGGRSAIRKARGGACESRGGRCTVRAARFLVARRFVAAPLLAICLALTACENNNPVLILEPPPPGSAVSLQRDVQPIFTLHCAVAGCHDSGSRSSGLVLESGGLYDPSTGLVGVPSQEAAGRLRVAPGQTRKSYIINKLEGTQLKVGGAGERMPFGGPYLPADTIQNIKDWIHEGAPNN